MKRTTVTTLVANLRRAIARCLDRISARATHPDSSSRGTSRIGDMGTTGVLCPDVKGGRTLFAGIFGALPALFLATTALPAGEQDNWYIANEWSVPSNKGVFYHVDQSTNKQQVYVCNGSSTSGKISVYDLNGSLDRHIAIANSRYDIRDLTLDANGTIYIAEYASVTCLENNGTFKWRMGKNASISSYGSPNSGNGEFNYALGIAISPTTGELFIADLNNHRVQVLDRNGTFKRKFGSNGSAPGQFNSPKDLAFLSDGTLVVGDNSYLHYYHQDGTFLKRVNANNARSYVSVAPDDTLFSYSKFRGVDGTQIAHLAYISYNARTAFTPEFDLIESYGSKIKIWKRSYRTKGLPTRNVIPQPAIRSIAQRTGTNVIDLDFEIVDPDDGNWCEALTSYCTN
ncbi:MAG: NHL repeat-containing protein, partial [Opitutales bacterium]|nr:NHL repeat-containing protein [Opitutales bacterium]